MKNDGEGVIIEATSTELYHKYMKEEYFEVMSFAQFIQSVKNQGCKIIDEENNKNE